VIDANPPMPGYAKIMADLGWFSWVYKDRDPMGFSKKLDEVRWLGIDQIVSDHSLTLPAEFKATQDHYPFVYGLSLVFPKAFLGIVRGKLMSMDPNKNLPKIRKWDETLLSISASGSDPMNWGGPDILFIQKTFLPGWKALVNGTPDHPFLENKGVFTLLHLSPGMNNVELKYAPTSLRLGFFLFFLFFSVFTFYQGRRLSA
ncbi:MAG TPA: hypothetical protein VMV05_02060, partial [bacterium]|nr:hypothetical protein [bacterium]